MPLFWDSSPWLARAVHSLPLSSRKARRAVPNSVVPTIMRPTVRAVVSSSNNCRQVLIAAGIEDLFEERIDGLVVAREHLKGKPAPDSFLAGARALGVTPGQAAVFEDALAGVAAGRAGGFAYVIGVDRAGQADQLRTHGADIVVSDLAELLDS